MRFLVDMGLGLQAVAALRDAGHDAVYLRELELQRLPDAEIVGLAVRESRILLAHDLDMGRIVALSSAQRPSLVTFRLADMRPVAVIPSLFQVLESCASDLAAGAMVTVTDAGMRCRRLPIRPDT